MEVTHGLLHIFQGMKHNIDRESQAPYVTKPSGVAEAPENILLRLREAEARYQQLPGRHLQNWRQYGRPRRDSAAVDWATRRSPTNRAFLSFVERDYWQQIGEGQLRPSSDEAFALLASVRSVRGPLALELQDLELALAELPGNRRRSWRTSLECSGESI